MSKFKGQEVETGLVARGLASNPGVTGDAQIGNKSLTSGKNEGSARRSYPLATVVGSFSVTAAAASNVATLTVSTGALAQTTGVPVIDGSGVDFEGDPRGASTKLMAIRVRTPAENTGTVTLGGSSSGLLPAITLQPDSEVLLKLPAAGVLHSTATQSYTFSATGDEVYVEYLAG